MEEKPTYVAALCESQILQRLPGELADLLRTASKSQYLNALALAALEPRCTDDVFTLYEPIFADLAMRWVEPTSQMDPLLVLAAFSRILPFAPYLRAVASQYTTAKSGPLSTSTLLGESKLFHLDDTTARMLLLTVFRLSSLDLAAFSSVVSPLELQSLFWHRNRSVRYLAVRNFCLCMCAADFATERMIEAYVGNEPIMDEWEGTMIDYKLLGLWEERRWQALEEHLQLTRNSRSEMDKLIQVESFRESVTNRTAEIAGVLLPRLRRGVSITEPTLVKTPTVLRNLRQIAKALLNPKPLLLIGLPDSGKTSLVSDIAAAIGQETSMITLHLNEHTDAKGLLGMYTSSTITGSFIWQPGVLTQAAREGRWVLIEDLDRAPDEVLGLILPVIEKGELTIPSRKERIKCSDGFRIIATIRSSINNKGEETPPNATILGGQLWQRVRIDPLKLDEVRDILCEKFPLLSSRVPLLISVYERLCSSFHGLSVVRASHGRRPGLRDIIKLCNRLHRRLQYLGTKTGYEPTPEGFQDEMFLDCVDIFLNHLPSRDVSDTLAEIIAEVLQISPQRVAFCLHERTPIYLNQDSRFLLGRETCRKASVSKHGKPKTTDYITFFAPTKAALKTMEQIVSALQVSEPILLVGETGVGKTAIVQQLAALCGQKLTVVNLSQQSETTDLLGGFKPVNVRSLAIPLMDDFNYLFERTFSAKKNEKFMSSILKSVGSSNWPRSIKLWQAAICMAQDIFRPSDDSSEAHCGKEEQPFKKRKLSMPKHTALRKQWEAFNTKLRDFEARALQGDQKFAFTFVEGKIVRALRNGEWVLLDEINLASPDVLENIAGLLHQGCEKQPSVLLSEAGNSERIYGHPDFRIFGAMNPATDAGKRELIPSLRSRFTELYVHSPDNDFEDLLNLVQSYLGDLTISDSRASSDLAHLYLEVKKLSMEHRLADGAGQRPHFSVRTLVRVLYYVLGNVQVYGIRRALYEGFCMSFLTLLNRESEKLVIPLVEKHIFGSVKNVRSLLSQIPRLPDDGNEYVQFRQYWVKKGPFCSEKQSHYIITPFIEKNLKNLLRASSIRRFPILLQGPTSSGKTSMVEYLAKISGNKFVRINNHDHTDLQEYLGSYISTSDGSLRYQEGILVEALRHGYWIVLDELNLAPSDVLEALNRLLDDNRELFLPETQETIHPHPNFMLFATQNPAGLYGGRKVLSRAFRNRFLELHFDDIPEDELEFILKERSQIAPSFCSRIAAVYKKLSVLRQSNRLFEQRNSFATLRDLFRWAFRRADDREQLAINGFMLLAERVRSPQERAAVKSVIEDVMNVHINEDIIYSSSELEKRFLNQDVSSTGIIWTKAIRRLFILVSEAINNNEPVLLVGETGCGKTQLCQALATIHRKELFTVNAHVNLETGDLIGAQRPLRNRIAAEKQLHTDLQALFYSIKASDEITKLKSLEELKAMLQQMNLEETRASHPDILNRIELNLTRSQALFEWSDGSLVSAMKKGQHFLLDEVSLADDSVLERLNSVLEPHRSILLVEKGPIDSLVVANEGFQFFATMNPGGDYGKRELSAALRNRLTEIWVPQLSEEEDILPILETRLKLPLTNVPKAMLEFAKWFKSSFQNSLTFSVSIRDLLAWVDFVNTSSLTDPHFALVHGGAMVFIDTLGANPSAMLSMAMGDLAKSREACIEKLGELFGFDASQIYNQPASIAVENGYLCVGQFRLPAPAGSMPDPHFIADAPTTIANLVRVARGLQSSKPILLEGSPGVGKTTLIAALARALDKHLTRINLSEQTDLTDLFGSDAPVEGGEIGQFSWRDAPFLHAMQHGHWVLLDEMNLASQSVLEGLNSCLDHRQQVYVSELDQVFERHPDFVLFAAQNPHHQGGGRKGLPASFVNRFTVVYADSFNNADLTMICEKLFPRSSHEQTRKLVDFTCLLNTAISEHKLGTVGGPWEVNLRDLSRWLQLADRGDVQISAGHFLDTIISQRFRTEEDRTAVSHIYKQLFPESLHESYYHDLTQDHFQVGFGFMQRDLISQHLNQPQMKIIPRDLPVLQSLVLCIQESWPAILVGEAGCGKKSILRKLAAINGNRLVELTLNTDTDTMDLIGGFEQIDYRRQISIFANDLASSLLRQIICALSEQKSCQHVSACLEVYLVSQQVDVSLDSLLSSLSRLCEMFPDLNLDEFLDRCRYFTDKLNGPQVAGFEWTEGILTEALQHGDWIVLENANLCNASVLDRLNSLMEPNGLIVLNEQRTEDGSARVISPHPNFRLFLTMDPQHGELSRSMRNRSVEICFLPPAPNDVGQPIGPVYTCQSSLYRLRNILNLDYSGDPQDVCNMSFDVFLDHLSVQDLTRFHSSLGNLYPSRSDRSVTDHLSCTIRQYASMIQEKPKCDISVYLSSKSNEFVRQHPLIADRISQAIHPLVNEPVISLTEGTPGSPSYFVAAACLREFILELCRLQQGLEQANQNAHRLAPSQMTRLERSLASKRIPSLVKDSTQPIGWFLKDSIQLLRVVIQNLDGSALQLMDILPLLRDVIHFSSDLFSTTHSKEINEAELQTYLQIGRCVFTSSLQHESLVTSLTLHLTRSLDQFCSDWALTTGLSMQRIWDSWRPVTCIDRCQLKHLMELEDIASVFMDVAIHSRVDISQLSCIRDSLIDAQDSILANGIDRNGVIPRLKESVEDLQTAVKSSISNQIPHFASLFEILCQYHDLSSIFPRDGVRNSSLGTLPFLARRPAKPVNRSNMQSQVPSLLHRLSLFGGFEARQDSVLAWKGNFSLSLLSKIALIGNSTLGQLGLLTAERTVLAQTVASSSSELSTDQFKLLSRALSRLCLEIIDCHRDFFDPKCFDIIIRALRGFEEKGSCSFPPVVQVKLNESLPESHYFRSFVNGLSECISFTAGMMPDEITSPGLLLIRLAVNCLQLFVPDKTFDPSLELTVKRKRYVRRVSELTLKDNAISAFELVFSSQTSNLRRNLLKNQLQELGSGPPQPPVTRPIQSQSAELQGEFQNLIVSILNEKVEDYRVADFLEHGDRLRANVRQICHRLKVNYRSYDDVVLLVIHFLHLLDLGISIVSSDVSKSPQMEVIQLISDRTPFLGGKPHLWSNLTAEIEKPSSRMPVEIQFHELFVLLTSYTCDQSTLSSIGGRRALQHSFAAFHELWGTKVKEDKEKEAQKSQLYSYRGTFDNDEEVDDDELRRFFPTFEDSVEEESIDPSPVDLKSISTRLAKLHANIFSPGDAQATLRNLVIYSAQLLGSIWVENQSSMSPVKPKDHLPGIILLLGHLNESECSLAGNYNFYTDANLSEAKKLIPLVLSVQSHFFQLQVSWPEHAVIQDVIVCCKEILEFQQKEPVAKFLTKLEKLYAYIHEWQLVTSQKYSAASLYENLTALIISWRRLELSTWAKLLDIEDEKCEQDASAWWFVAYEALIAAPLQMIQLSEDISVHTREAISTLEGFVKSAAIGQYAFRLRLVDNFRTLLVLYSQEYPSLSQLASAVGSFLEHFLPFEAVVSEALHQGRGSLEKEIKQQIQLTGWKDTNIIALKESARRSHYKLFKLVRKYRALLSRPAETVLQKDSPGALDEINAVENKALISDTGSVLEALAMCEMDSNIWNSRAQRFRDPHATANNMSRLYAASTSDFTVTEQLNSFTKDVVENIETFKSQTPGILTEENRAQIQHFKTQKHRFYSEVLRRLYFMGVRRNLNNTLLDEQATISQVLATTPNLDLNVASSFPEAKSANSYFHRFLDLLPGVRQASREYSEDLSPAEASKSGGSAEGLLLLARRQRDVLFPALLYLASLKSTFFKMTALWDCVPNSLSTQDISAIREREDIKRVIAQLTPVVELGLGIIEIHSKLSGVNLLSTLRDIEGWKHRLYHLKTSLGGLPDLPIGISSKRHVRVIEETLNSLNLLTIDMVRLRDERPELSFVIDQMLPWTELAISNGPKAAEADYGISLDDFNDHFLQTIDKIFVGIQAVVSSMTVLPSSTDFKDWLSQTDSKISRSLRELHIPDITASLESVLCRLRHLRTSQGELLPLASAIIASVFPIIEQYYVICADLIGYFVKIHREVCKMSYILAKSFIQVASSGFCGPPETSDDACKAGKPESGTGLGDGEAAEDISKNVHEDEDLSELAQQNAEISADNIENTEDAVNMDEEELDAEPDEHKDKREKDTSSENEGEDDIEEEVGSVNSLDPSAVDEKLWDASWNEEQKETENEEGKGVLESKQPAISNDNGKRLETDNDNDDRENEEEEYPDNLSEAIAREEMDVTDPYTKEEQALDLPEEMHLDGDEGGVAESDIDEGMDDLSSTEQSDFGEDRSISAQDDQKGSEESIPHADNQEMMEKGQENLSEAEDKNPTEEVEETELTIERNEHYDLSTSGKEDNNAPGDETAPSQEDAGGLHPDDSSAEGKAISSGLPHQCESKELSSQNDCLPHEGSDQQREKGTSGGGDKGREDSPQLQAFKKIGNILEEWHRRRREIMDSSQRADSQAFSEDPEITDANFEHLADESDIADTQALGQANEEQVIALDQSQAMESDAKANDNEHSPNTSDESQASLTVPKSINEFRIDHELTNAEGRGGATFAEVNTWADEPGSGLVDRATTKEVDKVDAQLAEIHLSSAVSSPLTSYEEAKRLWSHHESITNDPSLYLTEQLRLILAPTLATKLRGDFRTGKRLNIKRIIPYIASQYKRDKIWMRRSIPSKRNYQIMLAVDDSKSMFESGSGQLAFETLALVARSLSMLEVGDLCILSFGNEAHVRVAHEFGKPFSSGAGIQVFQQFSYQQTGTNVRKLITDSIALFREARSKRSGGSTGDLWQLELIVSDGICEDHDDIRRLVSQAQEERIMIVFIILDAIKGNSILDLTQASFEPDETSGTGEMKLKMRKYLEGFPFPYYLVVQNMSELPTVLAMALKQWLSEIAGIVPS